MLWGCWLGSGVWLLDFWLVVVAVEGEGGGGEDRLEVEMVMVRTLRWMICPLLLREEEVGVGRESGGLRMRRIGRGGMLSCIMGIR